MTNKCFRKRPEKISYNLHNIIFPRQLANYDLSLLCVWPSNRPSVRPQSVRPCILASVVPSVRPFYSSFRSSLPSSLPPPSFLPFLPQFPRSSFPPSHPTVHLSVCLPPPPHPSLLPSVDRQLMSIPEHSCSIPSNQSYWHDQLVIIKLKNLTENVNGGISAL